ncbi:hypothetical protein [Eubacterium sp. 1001713B170207_170306_E7]|uniref:hypothetical protein n=1 Tax=Eubacterium sp. 1001713B170207_170306_E7 TaxID=2787097 RepID=UPI00189ACDC9|nr:hypothetical protein [Eubacterium sp. 1001713B170207_170306_E7]
MNKYKIADISIEIDCFGKILKSELEKYKDGYLDNKDFTIISQKVQNIIIPENNIVLKPDSIIDTYIMENNDTISFFYKENKKCILNIEFDKKSNDTKIFLSGRTKKEPNMTLEDWEYNQTGYVFSKALVEYNGFCLHASAISVNNKAILFSAPSGTGKTTHTNLWLQYFGKDRVNIFNDDTPAIRQVIDKFYAYGTPWAGSSRINSNIKAPIAAIVFLKQGEKNTIRKLSNKEAVNQLFFQAIIPKYNNEKVDKILCIIDQIIRKIPVYEMRCRIDNDAVKTVYEAVFGG